MSLSQQTLSCVQQTVAVDRCRRNISLPTVMTNLSIFFIIIILENTYRVHVFTGDVSNAGTNSNVFICVYGERGDTGEQKLEKSETHMDKFERNNVRTVLFMHGNKEQTCFFYFGVVLSVMNRSVKENVKQISAWLGGWACRDAKDIYMCFPKL